jgi:hypothetical protein
MLKRFKHVEGLTNLIAVDKLLVNIHGKVKDLYGEDLPVIKDENGDNCVFIDAWDGKRNYRLLDLLAVQFKCYDLPWHLYKEVVAFPIDGDKDNLFAENIGYRFRTGKLEIPGHQGFYYIPGFLKCGLNAKLELLYIPSGQIRRWYKYTPSEENNPKKIKGGYMSSVVTSLNHPRTSLARHRAALMVFSGYPDNVDSLVVNHKNGIPGDDRLNNLEWNTRSENNTHAYEADLKTQHMRVLSRNVFTGEIREYRSISECARRINLNSDESMRGRLYRSPFGKIFSDGLQFKFKTDPRPWPEISKEEINGIGQQIGVEVSVLDLSSNSVKTYSSITAAGSEIGINKNFIRDVMLSGEKNPHRGFYIRIKSNDPWPVFSQDEIDDSFSNTQKIVLIKNLRTEEILEFPSTKKASEYLKSKGFLDGLNKRGWSFSGTHHLVKYKKNIPWPVFDDLEEILYRRQTGVMAKCEKTGAIHIDEDCTRLAKKLGLDSRSVIRAANLHGSVVHRGFRFRRGISADSWPV